MAAISFQRHEKNWFEAVGLDLAALHITVFAIEEFIDRILHRREKSDNVAARLHLQEGLRLLRERLLGDDDEKKISDSTVSAVLKLVVAAHFDGDFLASKHHINGLRRIVDMRGGLETFRGKAILTEMLR